LEVGPACDLLDEDGCEALGAKLLVNTEEIDLYQVLGRFVYMDVCRYATDESNQPLCRSDSDANVPERLPSWRLKCP